MTTEEKLKKAIDFIKSIESLNVEAITTDNILDDADIVCDNCDDYCHASLVGPNAKWIEASFIDDLKDKAWHVLVDLA